ncbi:hypothetical protein [Jannaschia seohaensis]|uniref:Uncharacterized protein n=1 Tax=Jannaschia seohaensis TaxID=475081 RepID=A0A2Y9AQH5_9RHOB|nr:hypothetical protein [Jannaschia seohaensis]PWJ18109.1 hypothetical protein BCF38_10596 [Jannaschia seohaensis]SSA46634.1 hypothetical protein SAMN05421539_10596 [Jannaschia seohaensis]
MRYALPFLLFAMPALADAPIVEGATARQVPSGWTFSVTVSHPDSGWEHYADGWSVFSPDGTELGHRKLLHPHETEQPFTRSLSGVAVPEGVMDVTLRAHDSVHGWGAPFTLPLR